MVLHHITMEYRIYQIFTELNITPAEDQLLIQLFEAYVKSETGIMGRNHV